MYPFVAGNYKSLVKREPQKRNQIKMYDYKTNLKLLNSQKSLKMYNYACFWDTDVLTPTKINIKYLMLDLYVQCAPF